MKKAFKTKFWEGSTVYFESVGFRYTKDGKIASCNLMFKPDQIISVTADDWKTSYVEGKDYIIQGKQVIRPEGSSIPVYPFDRNQPKYEGKPFEPEWEHVCGDPTRYVSIDQKVHEFQICVTYTHSEKWGGIIPADQHEKFPNLFAKLAGGEDVHLVYYGDSIEAGWEASGADENVVGHIQKDEQSERIVEFHIDHNRAPYLPTWAKLITLTIRDAYSEANVIHCNRSCGGMHTAWGVENVEKLIFPRKPDLLPIAFGMNQAAGSVDSFIADTRTIMERVHAAFPACEFLLISPMEPNRDATPYENHLLLEQEKALYKLAEELSPEYHVAVAPVHTMFREVIARGKTHADITGNNINHPNDFSTRLYFHTIAATLGL